MASKYLQRFPVPAGFQQILSDFTKEVLRDQPQNIIEYAAKYFQMLEKGQKFQFDSKYNVRKEDKQYSLNHNPKKAQDIAKKANAISQSIGAGQSKQSVKEIPKEQPVKKQPVREQQKKQSAKIVIQQHHQKKEAPAKQPSLKEVAENVEEKEVRKFMDQLSKRIQKSSIGVDLTRNQKVKEIVNETFPDFDKDGNGYLDSKQLNLFVKAILIAKTKNPDVEYNKQAVSAFQVMIDTNKDGKIQKNELQEFIRWFMGDLI